MAEQTSGEIRLDSGLPKISTPGDIGAASIGLALGYFLDVLLAPHFPHLAVTPGSASVYTSAAVLGFKNLVQSLRSWRNDKSLAGRNSPLFRATKLEQAMAREVAEKLTDKAQHHEARAKELVALYRESLLDTVRLYNEGFLTDSKLNEVIDQSLDQLTSARELRQVANKREAEREEEAKRREAERTKARTGS
jgi:hypothetical protein